MRYLVFGPRNAKGKKIRMTGILKEVFPNIRKKK